MKTTPTRLVPSILAGYSKAAEGCRTPKASPLRMLLVRARASWTAAALCRFSFAVLLLLGQFGVVDRAAAQVPDRFSFQGYMEDGNGQPLGPTTPVNYVMIFKIFPAATGGTPAWSERQIVTVDKGNYSVILGEGTAPNPGDLHGLLSDVVINTTSSELYVETMVTINGSPATIKPRLRLLPTMYSFVAKKALSVDGGAITAGSITPDRLNSTFALTATNGPVADSRLSLSLRNYITNGPISDAQISLGLRNYITNGVSGTIVDSRLSANVARRDTPNTFTGNQTVNGSALVTGDLRIGPTSQYSAVGTQDTTKIVAGRLPSLRSGTTTANGPGWAATKSTQNGEYWLVTFTTPFSAAPVVTAGWARYWTFPTGGDASAPMVAINGGSSIIVYGFTVDGGDAWLDTHFIAIGPR